MKNVWTLRKYHLFLCEIKLVWNIVSQTSYQHIFRVVQYLLWTSNFRGILKQYCSLSSGIGALFVSLSYCSYGQSCEMFNEVLVDSIFKTWFLQKVSVVLKCDDMFFSVVHQMSLRTPRFCVCKFKDNYEHANPWTKCWKNLLWKCYNNAFVLIDEQIAKERSQTIANMKGRFFPKLSWKKVSNKKPMANIVSATGRRILCCM